MAAGNRGGRPTKLTAETRDMILAALQSGCYMQEAAAAAGVDKRTLQRWMERGKAASKGFYFEFRRAVEGVQGKTTVADLAIIRKAASKDWRAAAWRLEHRYPERWGRRLNIDAKVRGKMTGIGLEVPMSAAAEAAYRKRFYKMFPALKPPRKNAAKK